MKHLKIVLAIICFSFFSCQLMNKKEGESSSNKYLIETSMGNIEIQLYDATPIHKANFEKLVEKKFFDGLLFHRVIAGFMVQGGDPESLDAPKGEHLGIGGPGYTLEAEIVDTLFHKRGALAAARQGDQVNPERRSSGSQFYIVQGTSVQEQHLKQIENMINGKGKQRLARSLFSLPENKDIKDMILYHQSLRNMDSLRYYASKIDAQVNDSFPSLAFKYTQKAIDTYKQVGGTPQLDQDYTVFGEVTKGMDIVDSIASMKVDADKRPLEDIKMTIKRL